MELRSAKLATNPYEYQGTTPSELGYEREATHTWFEEYAPELGRRMGVFATQPVEYGAIKGDTIDEKTERSPDLTIIMPASHDYRLEPLWMRRMEIMASAMDARVIGVDMPGTTGLMKATKNGDFETYNDPMRRLKGSLQTIAQYTGALRGDFRAHAQDELEAIEAVVGLDSNKRYAIFGESMGVAVATDMVGLMKQRGLQVSDVILYELVNAFKGARPTLPLELMSVLPKVENDRRNEYILENTEIGHPMTAFELSGASDDERSANALLDSRRKTLAQQGVAAVLNGLGMMHGRFDALSRDLKMYGQKERPSITLVRGQDSLAAQAEHYNTFESMLNDHNIPVKMIEVTDRSGKERAVGHAHLVSLGRQAQVASELKRRIN